MRVELTRDSGEKLGAILFDWDESSLFGIKNVRYEIEDDLVRNAIVGTARDNPEGLLVYGGRIAPTLENRLDGIYTALWWVRNGLGLDVAWKGPKLTPPPGVVF